MPKPGFRLGRDLANDPEIRQIFFGEGSERLTDKLIDELVARGWDRARLLEHRANGGVYCRPRDSILYPVHVGG